MPKKITETTPDDVQKETPETATPEVTTEEVVDQPAKKEATAKAGKRSAKATKEAEAEAEKEARKAAQAEASEKPKVIQKPRVKKYSKNQTAMRAAIEKSKFYTAEEAIALLQKISTSKFDPTLEVHVRLDIDPRQADQIIRASTSLPAGSGKTISVAVLTGDEKKATAAAKAGADATDSEKILEAITKGILDFDVLVATPDMMPQLGRHAKVLGPKGLMPSPKSGTVSADPAKAVVEIKQGRLEIKNDATGIVHAAVGKLSFKTDDLVKNTKAVLHCISANRPSGVKGTYVKSVALSASMTPSVKIDPGTISA